MAAHTPDDEVDILILHGKSEDLVEYFVRFFQELGLRAGNVRNLPTKLLPQQDRVNHYIKTCKLPFMIATFDEEDAKSGKVRLNVVDEIARSNAFNRTDLLVLQEQKNGKSVRLASNAMQNLVTIPFERKNVHLALIDIVRELRSRKLLPGGHSNHSVNPVFDAGRVMNEFLEGMDRIWDNDFTPAWDDVHHKHYDAESNLSIEQDLFFQQYHRVFLALVKDRLTGEDLSNVCESAKMKSLEHACNAWRSVAEAIVQEATRFEKEHRVQASRNRELLNRASKELNNGRKLRGLTSRERIEHYKTAVELSKAFMHIPAKARSG